MCELTRVEILKCHEEDEAVKLIRVHQNFIMPEGKLGLFQLLRKIAQTLSKIKLTTRQRQVHGRGVVPARRVIANSRTRVERYQFRPNSTPTQLGRFCIKMSCSTHFSRARKGSLPVLAAHTVNSIKLIFLPDRYDLS